MKPYYQQGDITVYNGDCLEVLPTIAENSIDLIVVDWPYFRVKDEPWDRQWADEQKFLAWIAETLEQAKRLLKPNGSFYGFASPQMANKIETLIGQYFNVLNSIRWYKDDGWHKKTDKETIRRYLTPWEAVIFAEQWWSDESAAGESGYYEQCKALHKDVYAPVFGHYLESEFNRAKVTRKEVAALFPSINGNLTGCVSNWVLGYNCPTEDQYQEMRDYLNSLNGRSDYLRREYEDLRREYEDLRRPFNGTSQTPHTDLWTFKPVSDYPGKHPTEKPIAMMEHIIRTSSRPGDTVLDFTMGSGVTLEAARNLGRQAIGIDAVEGYCQRAAQRLQQSTILTLINEIGITGHTNGNGRPQPEQLSILGGD